MLNGVARAFHYVRDKATSLISAPTKGLLFWSFIEDSSPITVELHKGSEVFTRGPGDNQSNGDDVEFGLLDGPAQLLIKVSGNTVKQYNIAAGAITGSLTTDIPPARSNPSVVIDDQYIMSIGIMEAPENMKHQLYVHIASDQSDWMGSLPDSTPFWALCLPGAHDAGMNTTEGLDEIKSNSAMVAALLLLLGPIISGLVTSSFESYAIWLGGLTQKDTVTNMLDMGTRFFDFRPGFAVQELVDLGMTEIRHQHDILPGAKWVDSLTEILQFLTIHPTEIVQVSITSNGFAQDSMVPSAADLQNVTQQAFAAPGVDQTIKIVGPEVFGLTLSELRASNSRLIMTDSNHGPTLNALDAWNSADWATIDPSTMQAAYERVITASAQSGHQMTTFQVQATATDYYLSGPDKELLLTLLAANDYNLPLVSTKGQFDTVLLNFIQTYQESLNRTEHLVLLDDWVDGSDAATAIAITKDRISRLASFVSN